MFLFVGAANEGRILKYDGALGIYLGDFTSGYYPVGGYSYPAFGPHNDLYVKMWSYGGAIVRFDGHTGIYKNELIPVSDGHNFLFSKQNELLAFKSEYAAGPHDICRFDATTGAFLGIFIPNTNGRFSNPIVMRWGPDGNLYVSTVQGFYPDGTQAILRFDGTSGAYIDDFVSPTRNGIYISTDFVFGPDNNIYLSNYDGNSVTRFNGMTGQFMDVFASGGGLTGPYGVVFGPDKNLYVTSGHQKVIYKFDGSTGQFLNIFATNTPHFPTFVCFADLERKRTRNSRFRDFKYIGIVIQIIFGIIDDSGGVQIVPGIGPQPVPPWSFHIQKIWESMSFEEQDVLVAFVMHEFSGLMHNEKSAHEIKLAIRKGLGEKLSQHLELLIKQFNVG